MIVNVKPPDKHVNKINKPRRKLDSFDKCGLFGFAMILVSIAIEALR